MFPSHPVYFLHAPSHNQVLPRENDSTMLCIDGKVDLKDAQYMVWYRVVRETDGWEAIPWREAEMNGDLFSIRDWIPTGGPYRVESCARLPQQPFKDTIGGDICRHLFVGDLYLIAGQSNAVGYARDATSDAPEIGVNVYRLDGTWDIATHPLNDATKTIRKNVDDQIPGQSPWIAFGKSILHHSGVPVGLIPAAVGGAPLECWMPGQPLFENAMEMVQEVGALRGVLWYQGCADALAQKTENYLEEFLEMVDAFRCRLNQPELPFFTFQLNGITEPGNARFDVPFAQIRAQQMKAASQDNVFLIPTAGLPLYDQIHNNAESNIVIGEQASAQVLAAVYGLHLRSEPLQVRRVERQRDSLVLTVNPVQGNLLSRTGDSSAFRVFRQGRNVPIERMHMRGNVITLSGKDLHLADRLCYAQSADVTNAGIYDSMGSWVLTPFDFRLNHGKEVYIL